jgi:hypothetical protein
LEDLRAASNFLESAPPSNIYSDRWGIFHLRFFSQGKLQNLEVIESTVTPKQGAIIVLGGSRGYDLSSQMVSRILPSPFSEAHLDSSRRQQNWHVLFERSGPHHTARKTDLLVLQIGSE